MEFFFGLLSGVVIGFVVGFLIGERSVAFAQEPGKPGVTLSVRKPKNKFPPKVQDDQKAWEKEQERP